MQNSLRGSQAARLIAMGLAVVTLVAGAMPAHAEPDITITYVVDTPYDANPLVGTFNCDPGVDDDCPLRKAIELANGFAGGASKRIRFQSNYDINLVAPLPAITYSSVDISADDGLITRLVRVKGSGTVIGAFPFSNGNVFQVYGNDVRIDSLRIYGSAEGWSNILIAGSAKKATISRNLLGTPDPAVCPAAGAFPAAYGGIYVGSTGAIDVAGGEARAWIWGNNMRCYGSGNAIEVNGTNQVFIGSDDAGLMDSTRRNQIFGNEEGVVFAAGANYNYLQNATIQGNTIGVRITGDTYNNFVKSNLIEVNTVGVQMENGANFNLVGTNSLGTPADANTIRANLDSGVVISGSTTHDNAVHGNIIGRSGAADPVSNGNAQYGVKITAGAYKNYIGFSGSSLGSNVIGGNGVAGIGILDGAKNNEITANRIGASVSVDTPIPNALGLKLQGSTSTGNIATFNLIVRNNTDGVDIDDARSNTIGDSNIIALNGRNGVLLQNGARDNLITSQAVYANGRHGISLSGDGTTKNQLNLINTFLNLDDGVNENSGAAFNTWTRVTTENNGGLGIDTDAGADTTNNITPPFPLIQSVTPVAGGVEVKGLASRSPSPTASNTVELFGLRPDASGYGEGAYYFGSVTVDMATGEWSTVISSAQLVDYPCFTAYQTFTPGGGVPPASSEFSLSSCRAMLPIIMR